MKLFLVACFCLVGAVLADDYITELCRAKYVAYKKEKKPSDYPTTYLAAYGANLAEIREKAFMKNCRDIEEHNRKKEKTWTKGINQFTDWTDEEFKSYLNLRLPEKLAEAPYAEFNASTPVVGDTDLRKKGWVNPVRNQGGCGSCWAFATVAAFEINHARKYGHTEASEQWVVDCDHQSLGCNGGWYFWAWDMVLKSGGKMAARNGYDTYRARQGSCHTPSSYAGTLSRYFKVRSEGEMPNNVENYGAIAVAVDAAGFGSYRSGIFTGYCGGQINHAVVIVGYGNANGHDYWLIRNSWGASWGEAGYIRILRGRNHCSVGSYAYIPVSESN